MTDGLSTIQRTPHNRLRSDRKDIIFLVLWCLGLGIVVCWVSLTLRLGTRQDALHNLTAVLEGTPLKFNTTLTGNLPFYSRIMFPSLHHALSQTFPALSPEEWYVWLRIFAYQGAFLAFALVCRFCLQAPRLATGLATAILALATMASFNHRWEEPSDALDIVAFSLGVGAILRRRFILCFILTVVFAMNRDSAAFLGVAWVMLLATRQNVVRRGAEGVLIFAAGYATALAIRWMIAPHAIKHFDARAINLKSLLEAITSFNPLSWLVLLAATFLLFLPFLNFARPRAVGFVALGLLLALPTVWFGLINEIRIFLPTFVVLAFAVAESLEESTSGSLTSDGSGGTHRAD